MKIRTIITVGKITVCVLLSLLFVIGTLSVVTSAEDDNMPFDVDAVSAVLMEASTGKILYAKNADEALPPASVTKIMTLLLVMEAVDSGNLALDEQISVSEYAASMGGSQVYLEPGEMMSCEDLIKSIVISSANDAAVAMAERVSGSEEGFVRAMNEHASALGMTSTNFENVTGLDDDTTNHVTSAKDIAIMSRALIAHPLILQYSSIWMDSIRDGAFGLTNTNRLVRFYSGATGLKTGSTSKAKFCISATACRDNMHLIAVIMSSPTRDVRNEAAKKLLDYGFANYALFSSTEADMGEIHVLGGVKNSCKLASEPFSTLMAKGKEKNVVSETVLSDTVAAPVKTGDTVGILKYTLDGEEIGQVNIVASEDVEKISYFGLLLRMLRTFSLT